MLERDAFYTPPELDDAPELHASYTAACRRLFAVYHELVEKTQAYLATLDPQRENERDGAFRLRLRRIATDACRFILPASTLTNVGVTMNTRSLEHAVRKLLSSDLQEERELGEEMKEQSKIITPTLVRHADRNDYLVRSREALQAQTSSLLPPSSVVDPAPATSRPASSTTPPTPRPRSSPRCSIATPTSLTMPSAAAPSPSPPRSALP